MFERYTESARRVLFFARYEVSSLGATAIGPEHLLLGLLREGKGLVGGILAEAHVSGEALRRDVERTAPAAANIPTSEQVPFTAQAHAVLRAAAEEADHLLHGYIGTEHLLLGLLRVDDSPTAALLTGHGLRLADTRQAIVRLSGGAARLAVTAETCSRPLEQAVGIYTKLLTAWNRRDAPAFASCFAAAGSAVGFDGSQMNGPGEIESALHVIFSSHQTASYVAKVRDIRPLGSGAALLRAVAGMIPPGTRELNPAVNAVQSVVLVNEGSDVKIALLQNTPAAFHGRPQLAQQLTEELSAVVRSGRIVDSS